MERLSGALLGLGVCLLAIPVTVLATILLMPVWSWLESSFTIEAVGHSGPAEWCYLFTYFIIVTFAGVFWSIRRQRQEPKQ